MSAVEALAATTGVVAACEALGVPRASIYRRRQPKTPAERRSRPTSPRALSPAQRAIVLDTLNGRFVDVAPAEVCATLLDEGTYLCSSRTMNRVLQENGQARERRDQARHPAYAKPELLAERPNELWSWDITKLRGPTRGSHFALYVILDVFSRYVVGWSIDYRESDELAKVLIADTCAKEKVAPASLTIHADRGPSMTSKTVETLLADLGVAKSHSRPHVSNDNPYSESQFKTLKYRPGFPDRFGSEQDARTYCRVFFPWYNTEHRHSGIAMLTPADVHFGRAQLVLAKRQAVLDAAYAATPERFVAGRPRTPKLPSKVWINEPKPRAQSKTLSVEGQGAGSGAVAGGPGTEIARGDEAASPVPSPSMPASIPQLVGAGP